jgi:uncharacterized protein YndB with AHSA1/START domain
MNDVIEQEVPIQAPIERVWQVVTDPECVARWFGSTAEIDLRRGGRCCSAGTVPRRGRAGRAAA